MAGVAGVFCGCICGTFGASFFPVIDNLFGLVTPAVGVVIDFLNGSSFLPNVLAVGVVIVIYFGKLFVSGVVTGFVTGFFPILVYVGAYVLPIVGVFTVRSFLSPFLGEATKFPVVFGGDVVGLPSCVVVLPGEVCGLAAGAVLPGDYGALLSFVVFLAGDVGFAAGAF